eukprot:6187533-Pleurochrysis_carterae.AAC.1
MLKRLPLAGASAALCSNCVSHEECALPFIKEAAIDPCACSESLKPDEAGSNSRCTFYFHNIHQQESGGRGLEQWNRQTGVMGQDALRRNRSPTLSTTSTRLA